MKVFSTIMVFLVFVTTIMVPASQQQTNETGVLDYRNGTIVSYGKTYYVPSGYPQGFGWLVKPNVNRAFNDAIFKRRR